MTGNKQPPDFYKVDRDRLSQDRGERLARIAATQACYKDPSLDFEYRLIYEKALRGVNMTFGAQ